MERARRHQRLLSGLAFVLLALVAELVGRSLTHNLNVGRHVDAPSYAGADYYPFLLAAVKGGIALLLSRLAWRFVRAHAAARAGRRVLEAVGASSRRSPPRLRIRLSPRLWLGSFAVTALIYPAPMRPPPRGGSSASPSRAGRLPYPPSPRRARGLCPTTTTGG